MSGFNAGPAGGPIAPGQLSSAKIRELMENAQRTIAERKQSLGIKTIPAQPVIVPQGLIANPEIAEKARKAAELQARIASRFESVVNAPEPTPPADDPIRKEREQMRHLIFDEHGKTIDAVTGEEIRIPQRTPTLKANVRALKAQTVKEVVEQKSTKPATKSPTKNLYFDSRLNLKSAARPKRQLSFFEPGQFVQLGQRLRTKAQLDKLQESIAQAAKRTGIASAAKLATIQPKRKVDESSVPDVEWWDAYILKDGITDYGTSDEYDDVIKLVNESWITDLIEHPIKLKAPTALDKIPEIPLLLTKKERKKLRRQNRQEAQKERQERVRLGLEKPPEPKVKGSGAALSRLNQQCSGDSGNEISKSLGTKSTTESGPAEPILKSSNNNSIKGFKKPTINSPSQNTLPTEANSIASIKVAAKHFKKPALSVTRKEDIESPLPKSTGKKPLPKINLNKPSSKHNSKCNNDTKVPDYLSNKETSKKPEVSLFDEVVDGFLDEYEDWTTERLYEKFSASFDYSLYIEDFSSKKKKKLPKINTAAKNESHYSGQSSDSFEIPLEDVGIVDKEVEMRRKSNDNHKRSFASTTTSKLSLNNFDNSIDSVIDSVLSTCDSMTNEEIVTVFRPSTPLIESEDEEFSSPKSPIVNSDIENSVTGLIDEVLEEISDLNANDLYQKHIASGLSSQNNYEGKCKYARKVKKPRLENASEVYSNDETVDIPSLVESPSGTWVECVMCKKWRYLEDSVDPSELPEDWYCGLQSKYLSNGHSNIPACDEPEILDPGMDEKQYVYGQFATGSIVLAKMPGYPEWPAMIDCDGRGNFAEICHETGDILRYRVVFLDPNNPTNQVLPASDIRKFSEAVKIKLTSQTIQQSHFVTFSVGYHEGEDCASQKLFNANVTGKTTIWDLKQAISRRIGMAPEDQVLTFKGIFMEDSHPLSDYRLPRPEIVPIDLFLRSSYKNLTPIRVSLDSDNIVSIHIHLDARVSELRSAIEQKCGISAKRSAGIRLIFGHYILNDDEKLDRYGIKKNSCILVVKRLSSPKENSFNNGRDLAQSDETLNSPTLSTSPKVLGKPPSTEDKIEINVIIPNGSGYMLFFAKNITLREASEQIEQKTGIPAAGQSFSLSKDVPSIADMSKTLEELGLSDGNSLYMMNEGPSVNQDHVGENDSPVIMSPPPQSFIDKSNTIVLIFRDPQHEFTIPLPFDATVQEAMNALRTEINGSRGPLWLRNAENGNYMQDYGSRLSELGLKDGGVIEYVYLPAKVEWTVK
uniref:Ubiquitin-like domain-containing protein n=1 Tax=Rodentolepis nana TaxID=102285 RepID=A0A158QGP0_RODNA